MLSRTDFENVVRLTPLVSIDLVIRNFRGDVLLGLRNNEPASGFYFVPGGRIMKDERLDDAFRRVLYSETGLDLRFDSARFKGPYEHFYPTNFANQEGFGTHYVVLAYELTSPTSDLRPDGQHRELSWWREDDARSSFKVHENTRAYF